jgi:hypothetical protein
MIEHIPMSPALRMLVMLLRRELLEYHQTLDSLLAGDERTIKIKEAALKLPVVLASGPRGLSVTEKALSARSLTGYMIEKTMEAGFGLGVGLYAWRRKAGTEVQRQLGTEVAQKFLTHQVCQ